MDKNSVAARAEWLAHLALAIDEARRLVRRLKRDYPDDTVIFDLEQRIEAARLEIQALRLRRWRVPFADDPKWRQFVPTKADGDDP